MNPDQIESQVRLWLSVASGIAGALGWTWFDGLAAKIAAFAGPAFALGLAVWSLIANKQANRVASVAAMPEVKKIELQPTSAGAKLEAVTPPNVAVAR